jgi:predicted O-methyltransferase YrrM
MDWFLQKFPQRAVFAAKNPGYVIRSLYRELTSADERFLYTITNVSTRRLRDFYDEPIHTQHFSDCLRSAKDTFQALKIESADLYAKKVLLQYAAVRAARPRIVVETGVANGVSSAYLLLALEANSSGTLYSIGLDDKEFLPEGKSLGWVVPKELRSRWKLLVGDSREMLPKLLDTISPIDLFIHDSLHTYDHMLWEYRTAYPALREGGLLFSDDALWNSAFMDFACEVDAAEAKILRGVGFLRKKVSRHDVVL